MIIWIALFMPLGLFFRIRSHTGEALDRRQEGTFSMIALRSLGFLGFAGLVAWLVNPALLAWTALGLPEWLRWIGAALGLGAGLLVVWIFKALGRNLTDTVVTRREHTLVTGGPYRWIRHPLYSCAALLVLATSLITANAIFLVGVAAVTLLMLRAPLEEANLVARFGEDYRNYMRRTGRFFPRL